MHEVKAIIRPQRLAHVIDALHDIPGLPGVTVSRVHAYAGSRPPDGEQPSENAETDFTKLEVVVSEAVLERVVAAIAHAGHTGHAGDGIVYVVAAEQFVRVRDINRTDTDPIPRG
jgi:nitrogen regulatory protein P-II 1